MLVHYAEFMYPGILFAESETRLIKSRKHFLPIPENCYGYRFFDREETKKGGEILTGKNKNYSGMTYFGKVYTLADVKKLAKKKDMGCLVSNMEVNNYKKVVQTVRGNWQPLEKGDKVI